MPKKIFFLKECSENCKSEQHVSELISAITLPSVTDRQLASFLKSRCFSFDVNHDKFGRSLLHIAASYGRKDLCQWLIKCCNSRIDDQDFESGYTPLHRSIYYGYINVAVTLMQLGANINICDHEDYCPIDMISKTLNVSFMRYLLQSKDSMSTSKSIKKNSNVEITYECLYKTSIEKQEHLNAIFNAFTTEVYTWGMNQNYTIGFGAERSKTCPEYLEFFEKKNEVIIEIYMHKYHTLFLGLSGNVWSCGLGQGGRLGLVSEDTVLIPQKVSFKSPNAKPSYCIQAAVGADHSIFMCNDNQIFTCGMNTYHQMGISSAPVSISKPQPVEIELWNSTILGVAASTFHSVVWTDCTLYVCGLHGGQLGHLYSTEITISCFKKVRNIEFQYTTISNVAVSEGATVVVTEAHDIYLLSGYKCQKIDFRHIVTSVSTIEADIKTRRNNNESFSVENTENDLFRTETVIKVAVMGGELDHEKVKSFNSSYRSESLKIAVLLWNGNVFLWQENVTRFLKCFFLLKRDMKVSNIVLNSNGMLLSTYKGEAFTAQVQDLIKTFGKLNDGFTKVNHRNSEETEECYLMKLSKIPNAFRTITIFSDPRGSNFALLQNRSAEILENIPQTYTSTFHSDFEILFEETCDCDPFHNIVYQVGRKSFAAHKYILASCCQDLKWSNENNGTIIMNDVHPDIFEQLLIFAYSGSCLLLQEGPCPIKIQRPINEKHHVHNSVKYDDPIKLSIKIAEEFKMKKYIEMLQSYVYEDEYIHIKLNKESLPRKAPLRFNRLEFKNLCDIKLKSQDGKIFNAHKCILIARMEYFKNMLCGNWIETSDKYYEYEIPVSSPVLLEILEFLYTDTVTRSVNKKDFNFWCSLLVAADQFILPKLKEISENAISQCLDTRNTCDALMFADILNAKQLIISCFEFICINLCSFLYSRTLEKLNDELLNNLTQYYKTEFSIRNRNIPIYSNIYDPKEVSSAESMCPVNWETIYESFDDNEAMRKSLKPVQKKKKRRTRKSFESEYDVMKEHVIINDRKSNISDDSQISYVPATQTKIPVKKSIPEEQWIEVEKQLKSVKSRLKVNAAVKNSPQLVEQKENFTPLMLKKLSPSSSPLTKSEISNRCEFTYPTRSPCNTIQIDFKNITPKMSQKQLKRMRRASESAKTDSSLHKNILDEKSFSPPSDSGLSLSVPDCWGRKNTTEAVCFSAIVASEKKHKTLVKKETKKIETKPLQLTQIEDKAIYELIAFYNANNVDDEHITVQRVIHDTAPPQWVTK